MVFSGRFAAFFFTAPFLYILNKKTDGPGWSPGWTCQFRLALPPRASGTYLCIPMKNSVSLYLKLRTNDNVIYAQETG